MTDIVQTNAIMYLAWRFLVLCFSGHIIALYLLRLMATKVYALTCTKHDNKIIRIVNIRKYLQVYSYYGNNVQRFNIPICIIIFYIGLLSYFRVKIFSIFS